MQDEEDRQQSALAALMGGAAHALEASANRRDTYTVATEQAVIVVPRAQSASITIADLDGGVQTVAATADPLAAQGDEAQRLRGEGPCLDAARQRRTLLTGDVKADPRWTAYGAAAAELGVTSQLAVQVFSTGRSRVGLNLYSRQPDAFDASVHTAELFASLAAIALGFANSVADLDDALDSRSQIGQAIGIVRERYQLDEHEAFTFLVRLSQDSNTRMRVVAQEMIAPDANSPK